MAHYKGRSRRAPYKAKFIHDGKYEEVPMILQEKDGNGTYICMQVSDNPSVPNYKSFQKLWRVKPSQTLIKLIERNTKIYDIKYVYYENITNKKV